MKVCFVGIGSIASRHIRNLREICERTGESIVVDALRRKDSSQAARDLDINMEYRTAADMPSDYDAMFITNPTELHVEALRAVHDKTKNFFIEKPITSMRALNEAENFQYRQDAVYYIACPMRYMRMMQYIKEHVEPSDVLVARSICSSYLPEWRPGTDYRQCYSARKDMGGGVSVDLIHEWDYLTWMFGYPQRVNAMIGQKSDLEIDADDYAIYTAEYADKVIELHLDYFGRKVVRELMLITKEDTIIADFVSHTVRYMKSGRMIDMQETRDDYCKKELCHFLDVMKGAAMNDNPPSVACKVMKLTQGIL